MIEQLNEEKAPLKTKTIKCPLCNKGRLINVINGHSPFNVRTFPPQKFSMAQYLVKCPKCGEQIGISIKH